MTWVPFQPHAVVDQHEMTLTEDNLELIELTSINKVSLV
jgi:hypothetical protein